MAIAFDATTNGGTNSDTSLTVSHPCTGSNLNLWVECHSGGGDLVSSVTYNGVALTQLNKLAFADGAYLYLYYLVAPSTGTNNIVISTSSTTLIRCANTSFTGANQSFIPVTSIVFPSTASQTSITTTVTIPSWAANSWLVGAYRNDVGNFTAGSNTTIRNFFTGDGKSLIIADSNGANAAGSASMTLTCSSANVAGIMAAFAPAGATPPATGGGFFMFK